MANSVVHFELPADDIDRAKTFYQAAFGWQTEAYPGMNYHGVTTTEVGPDQMPLQPGAINGGMFERQAGMLHPMITIGVDDIDAALQVVETHGGTTMQARQSVGEMGFTGYFTDPEGNLVGLWQNA